MASLNLKLMGPPGVDHLDNRFSVVLRDFLQPTSALTLDAATQLTLDALPDDAAHSHESWSLAETCVELAEQIPYHHTSQLKLAALMENLLRSKKLLAIPVENEKNQGSYNQFERLNGVLLDNRFDPDTEDTMGWVNWQAFCANLHECHIFESDPTWAIRAQRDAHEGRTPDGHKREILPDEDAVYVLGAAQWILNHGQSLFKQVLYSRDVSSEDLRLWSPGPLYDGKANLTLHRWHFWRDGYAATACEDHEVKGIALECRIVAAKAVRLMDYLEQCMTF